VKEDMKMYSTNLSILLEEKTAVMQALEALQSVKGSMPEVVVALKKRKRELEFDIGTDMFKLINRNRLLGVMIKYQRDILTRLDEADEALRATEEKLAAMQAITDRARVAARRC
ncbi:hypothetical protein A2U01_0058743, partial [Trifolium medium]|nr:hypothetical protein [Trifolium medium]